MNCPDLQSLGSALDLDPEDPSHLDALRHLRSCPECERKAGLLRDVELALGSRGVWSPAAEGCLSSQEMLLALAGESGSRAEHLAGCTVCQAELEVMSLEAREEPSASLKERLKGLVANASTTEELRVVPGRGSRRVSGTGRVRSGTGRLRSGTGRVRSGTGRISASGRLGSGRRKSGSLRRSAVTRRSMRAPRGGVKQPMWAWGVLAAAAALLVALAIALQPPPQRDLADADTPWALPRSDDTLRVSDVQNEPRPARVEPEPAPAVDPSYPLPAAPEAAQDSPETASEPEEPQPAASDTGGRDPEPASPEEPARPTRENPSAPTPTAEPELIPDDGGRIELALNRLRGGVTLERDGERSRLSRRNKAMELRPGDRLLARSGAFLSLAEGADELSLDADTALVVRAARGGPLLRLERGKVLAEVATLPTGKRFGVLTRQAEFSVLGTAFAVEAAEDSSRLLVAEGTVKASASGKDVQVPAGMAALVRSRAAPSAPAPFHGDELAWAQPWAPKRQIVYSARFDDSKLRGFRGPLSADHQTRPDGLALRFAPLKGNRYWGQWVHVEKGRMPGFRAAPDVYVQFSVWVEKPVSVLLQIYNDTQAKEFKRNLSHAGGYWRTFTVPLMEMSTYYDPGKNPVRVNDLFTDLEVYAGKPGDQQQLLIDDVRIFRKAYR